VVATIEGYKFAGQIIGALYRAGTPVGYIDPATAACAVIADQGLRPPRNAP